MSSTVALECVTIAELVPRPLFCATAACDYKHSIWVGPHHLFVCLSSVQKFSDPPLVVVAELIRSRRERRIEFKSQLKPVEDTTSAFSAAFLAAYGGCVARHMHEEYCLAAFVWFRSRSQQMLGAWDWDANWNNFEAAPFEEVDAVIGHTWLSHQCAWLMWSHQLGHQLRPTQGFEPLSHKVIYML